MPIYEYRCGQCDAVIEKIQKFADPPLEQHEGCGGALTKLISQSSFQLKGSGWYVTDYAGKGASQDGNGDKPDTGDKGDAKDEKKTTKEAAGKSEGDSKTSAGSGSTKSESSKTPGGGAARS